jgi:hypothetical protein
MYAKCLKLQKVLYSHICMTFTLRERLRWAIPLLRSLLQSLRKKREDQPTPKKAKTNGQSSSQQLQVSVNRGGANAGQGGNSSEMKKMKEVVRSFSKMFAWSSSASTTLVGWIFQARSPKLMAGA